MKQGELIAALGQVVNQLTDIITALKDTPESSAPEDGGMCPIHNVPWQKYKWGWAHPPTKPGEKWCRKPK